MVVMAKPLFCAYFVLAMFGIVWALPADFEYTGIALAVLSAIIAGTLTMWTIALLSVGIWTFLVAKRWLCPEQGSDEGIGLAQICLPSERPKRVDAIGVGEHLR